MNIEIRSYTPQGYSEIKHLYQESDWFDESVDSENMLNEQIKTVPGSIIVAISDQKIIGSLTMLATGRLALFFRLISNELEIRKLLLEEGEKFFREKGYNRLDIIAPEDDSSKQEEYGKLGFNKGNSYRWFWKN